MTRRLVPPGLTSVRLTSVGAAAPFLVSFRGTASAVPLRATCGRLSENYPGPEVSVSHRHYRIGMCMNTYL